MGHTVFVETSQLFLGSIKAATDIKQMNRGGCAPLKLYLQEQTVDQETVVS